MFTTPYAFFQEAVSWFIQPPNTISFHISNLCSLWEKSKMNSSKSYKSFKSLFSKTYSLKIHHFCLCCTGQCGNYIVYLLLLYNIHSATITTTLILYESLCLYLLFSFVSRNNFLRLQLYKWVFNTLETTIQYFHLNISEGFYCCYFEWDVLSRISKYQDTKDTWVLSS